MDRDWTKGALPDKTYRARTARPTRAPADNTTRITSPTLAEARAHASVIAKHRPITHFALVAEDGRSWLTYEARR